jgi:UDP-glucose 4-epimerase
MSRILAESIKRFFAGKTVLITGAGGYIASSLMQKLAGTGCEKLVRISRKTELPDMPSLKLWDIQADLSCEDKWDEWLSGVDVIFHLAGQTSAYIAEQNPQDDWRVNVLPLLNLSQACKRTSVKPVVIFASTATVIGLSKTLPVNEAHPEMPITIYDIHKLLAEKVLFHFNRMGCLYGCALRLANVYGPGHASGSQDRGVINKFIRMALDGHSLRVFGMGENVRDYVFIEDVVESFLLAAVNHERTAGCPFFIGSGRGHTLNEAIRAVAYAAEKITGRMVAVENVEAPSTLLEIEHRDFIADISAFSDLSGWLPEKDFGDGLDATTAFFYHRETRG